MPESGPEHELERAARDFCRIWARNRGAIEEARAREALATVLKGVAPQRRYPDVELGTELARCLPAEASLGTLEEDLSRLQVGDIWLALAARSGDDAAIRTFERELLAPTKHSLVRLDASASFREEVLQRVRVKLLVGSSEQSPRLANYRGRGALATWVNVVVIREAITMMRAAGRQQAEDADLVLLEATSSGPELAVIKAEHRVALIEALQAAIGALSPQERNLLRLHHLHGASIDQLGAMLQLHRSTAARRLEKIRHQVLDDTRRRLLENLQVEAAELDAIVERIRSRLDISLERMLE